jgi:twitching motility protein PilT
VSLLVSLIRAIDRADGEALVMHVGEKPYVITASGHAELAARPLTCPAMTTMLDQLLPTEARQQLDEFGAVEHHLSPHATHSEVQYTVIAARGGDDIWIEIRRRKEVPSASKPAPASLREPALAAAPYDPTADSTHNVVTTTEREPLTFRSPERLPVAETHLHVPTESEELLRLDSPSQTEPQLIATAPPVESPAVATHQETPAPMQEDQHDRFMLVSEARLTALQEHAESEESGAAGTPAPQSGPSLFDVSADKTHAAQAPSLPTASPGPFSTPSAIPSVVVPLARPTMRLESSVRSSAPRVDAIHHLLRIAAARGASALYLVSQSRPSIRVDGEVRLLDQEAPLTAAQVEASLLEFMPERNPEMMGGLDTEWMCDVPEVGRVRCVSFRDHRGPAAIFRMLPARAISAEQLGLSPQIQALCSESEGLVLVAGPRSSGKSTLIAAFVDQINRTRRDHVITIESQIQFVHESRSSLVSQREVRGEHDQLLAALRSALRENPDVIVVEELKSADVAALALGAASSGHLVIGALTAPTTTAAVEKLIDMFPADRRAQVRASLAENLRGIVAQVLLRKSGGGRLAAREVLLNSPAVAAMIAEGRAQHLASALDSGRRIGMVPLNDALLGFVQSGAVDTREAYRKSPDQKGLLALLKREGIDTSFAERLA